MTEKYIYESNDLSLEKEELVLNETIFHTANGYIGVRSNFEEGYPEGFDSIRGSYINGFYDFAEMKQAEKLCGLIEEKQTMLNVADSQGIKLTIEDETFSMFEGEVVSSKRYLDMKRGFSARVIHWRSPKGKEVEITSKRMTSFVHLSLFTIEYSVKAINFEGKVTITSSHLGDVMNYCNPNDPRVAGESFKHLYAVSAEVTEKGSIITSRTSKSNLQVCTGVTNRLSKEADATVETEGHGAKVTFVTELVNGEILSLVKYTVFKDSIRCGDLVSETKHELETVSSSELATLYKEQEEYLNKFWSQSDLTIEGDDDLAIAVRYNLYQLLQSVGKDQFSNVAAKGLSGEGYEGHFFWDTEMYMQPFFVLTNPEIAKNLISYRHGILEEAKENARILGHQKGALYPWRTIMGKECSGYFPSGSAQYHINGDIAYSVVAYYLATKDISFMEEKGAEILIETARLWMNVGNYYEDTFRINEVTGPDEYTCMVNNNYYTNVSAQYNLHWAALIYKTLKSMNMAERLTDKLEITEEEMESFEAAEMAMYLPYDEKLGINPQDDSFLEKPVWDIANTPKEKFPLLLHYHPLYLYRHQVCKQADTVLAHFVFEDAQSLETIEKSFEYYETVTTHDSSLSTCIYSIVASKLGQKEKAYDYFGDSAKLDLFNLHHNTKDGIHTANMGGNYMAVVYGFAGLRLKETGLFFAPYLPEKWTGYQFKIVFENSQIQVEVNKETCTFTLLNGESKGIHVFGQNYQLNDKLVIEVNR